MIVKDEEPVIRRAFDSIKKYLDYWVIVDTGSSDKTKEIINEFRKEVPGELYERPWVNFAHNRNEALNLARPHCDYMITMDADEIYIPNKNTNFSNLTLDAYHVNIQYGSLNYVRLLIMSSRRNWEYVGVIHELPMIRNENYTVDTIPNLYLHVTTEGNRSNDPDKFVKDAIVLEKALLDEPDNSRYVFYLAQSYRDSGNVEKSIENYKRRTTMGGWNEEIFISHYNIARLSNDEENKIHHALQAYNIIPERLESIWLIIIYYNMIHKFTLANAFCKLAENKYYPEKYLLFIEHSVYEYEIFDALYVTASWLNDSAKCIEMAGKLKSVWHKIPEYRRNMITGNINMLEERLGYKVW